MTLPPDFKPDPDLDLVLEREVDVPPDRVWAAWTQPEQLKRWFAPAPYTTPECEIDLRPGGSFAPSCVLPEGEEMAGDGCFLEVVETVGWCGRLRWARGSGPTSSRTSPSRRSSPSSPRRRARYTAVAMHSDQAACAQHADMGFHEGWGAASTSSSPSREDVTARRRPGRTTRTGSVPRGSEGGGRAGQPGLGAPASGELEGSMGRDGPMSVTTTRPEAELHRHGPPLARAGWLAKGAVFVIMGVLALQAAFGESARPDPHGALEAVAGQGAERRCSSPSPSASPSTAWDGSWRRRSSPVPTRRRAIASGPSAAHSSTA